jgi:glutamyl-tRNA synthetase
MSVVTRFPPSPTGFMHIGNARTALFNWLYARKHNGKFVVRIEDTDRKRHSEEAVEAIMRGLEWLELDFDGEALSQFANQARHKEVAEQLLAQGKAWKSYYTPEEREAIKKENGGFKMPRRAELEKNYPPTQTEKFTINIEAPTDGTTTIKDLVQGEVSVQNAELDDFILLRADGTPTYMLSVVVDDHDMGITHIMRGDDHLNNTFRQKVIFDAMGWDVPEFAHLPLIHGPDGAKFSKRHGATSVEEYRDMGYLPEAMRNYLLRLGWGHGDEEIIPTEKALEWFDFKGIGKAAAKFDFAKLESLNAHYINETTPERLIELCKPFYKERHGVTLSEEAQKRIIAASDELKSRAKTLLQFTDESVFFAKSTPLDFDEKASGLLDKDILSKLLETLEGVSDFTSENIQAALKTLADEIMDGKLGKVAMPLRAAITGTTVSPSVFHASEILGKEETCARIRSAMENA